MNTLERVELAIRLPAKRITITLPDKMNVKVEILMERLDLGRSRVIQILLEKALREYEFSALNELPKDEEQNDKVT